MKLQEEIINTYGERNAISHLYNSDYSRRADEERKLKIGTILKKHFGNAENKTILEIGAGQGNNMPHLRYWGFRDKNISLNEMLPERVIAIKSNFPEVNLREGDAMRIDLGGPYDCIYQSTVFTSLLKDEDRVLLAQRMWKALKPGGFILWYDFIYNNPKNPNVKKVTLQELKRLFPEAKSLSHQKITLAPPVGRRVGKFYKLFNFPILRSHLVAILIK